MNRQIQYKLHTQHNSDEKTINNMSTMIIESAAQHNTHKSTKCGYSILQEDVG